MSSEKFYTPNEIKSLYGEIIPAYQSAFEGDPWYEVSKCVDDEQRCPGGLSACAIGATCSTCGLIPVRPAYETDEMKQRFGVLADERDVAWYAETNEEGVTMAALAWNATPVEIADKRYVDVPAMREWMEEQLGQTEIAWLDEVFANRQIKSQGNLRNFGRFVLGLASQLGQETVAYRTISPQMVRVAERDFGESATIFKRREDVPDRRDFIIINAKMED